MTNMDQQNCTFAPVVGAYHDDELTPEQRQRFESHLANCPACEAELRALRQMSLRLRESIPGEMPPDVMARLHNGLDRHNKRDERSLLKIAGSLTAAAAAVLLASLAGLRYLTPADPQPSAQWEQVAIMLEFDDQVGTRQDPTLIFAWSDEEYVP